MQATSGSLKQRLCFEKAVRKSRLLALDERKEMQGRGKKGTERNVVREPLLCALCNIAGVLVMQGNTLQPLCSTHGPLYSHTSYIRSVCLPSLLMSQWSAACCHIFSTAGMQ